jgi:hypothetical protein
VDTDTDTNDVWSRGSITHPRRTNHLSGIHANHGQRLVRPAYSDTHSYTHTDTVAHAADHRDADEHSNAHQHGDRADHKHADPAGVGFDINRDADPNADGDTVADGHANRHADSAGTIRNGCMVPGRRRGL